MRGWLRWILGGAITLVALGSVAVALGLNRFEVVQARRINLPRHPIAYSDDPQSLDRGRYLFESRGCAECHGTQGGGRVFAQGEGLKLAAPNITSGGVTAAYANSDWERTIRHGVKPSGRPIFVMPSEDYNRLTDADVGALVSYIRRLPPQRDGEAVIQLPLPVRVLYGYGQIKFASDKIDHSLAPEQPVDAAITVKHGAYVAKMCVSCHGAHFSGGSIPGGAPDWPAAANLTPGSGSAMVRYKDATAFVAMLRSGKRPDGSAIKVMPFGALSKLSDVDARALYVFLGSVSPRPAGER